MRQAVSGAVDITVTAGYSLKWQSNVDFNKGINFNTEIEGTEDVSYVRLAKNPNNSNDVPFTTPTDYTYNPAEIEVSGGIAKLQATVAGFYDWTFTVSGDYTFDAGLVEVTGGKAKLKGTLVVPYAWWHMNESSGTNIADSSGYGRNGTTVGSPSWVAGKLNNCLQFTGTQYANMADIANFERTTPFSVEFWLKTTVVSGTIISRRESGGNYRGWDIMIGAGNQLFFYFANTTVSNMISVYTTFNLSDNLWHHVVATYDGSSSASGVKIYIDGASKTMTTQYNSLTGTTLNASNCNLAARSGSNVLNCYLDETVIYSKVLTLGEVTLRYNSGVGTETMIGNYSLINPPIYPNTGYVFFNPSNFIETATKPSGSEIKYHCSSNNGVTWKYWNGSAWVVTDDSYTQANAVSVVSANISSLAASGTFKFRALLHTDSVVVTPELDNVRIEAGALYPVGNYEISMNTDIQPTNNYNYLTTTETVTKPTNTNIKYQYSINSGSTYNGSWLTNSQLQTVLQGIICTGDGSDKIRFKFELSTTDNTKTPEINNLNVTSNAGYAISGTYESNAWSSGFSSLDWGNVDWTATVPAGCSLVFKARAGNFSAAMGSYGSALVNGAASNAVGKFFQWKCDFTGTVAATPSIDDFRVKYGVPLEIEQNP
jgi:hypothetical protein